MFFLVFVAVIVYIIIDSSNNNRDRGYNNEYQEKPPSLPESKIEKRLCCIIERMIAVAQSCLVVNTKNTNFRRKVAQKLLRTIIVINKSKSITKSSDDCWQKN